MVNLLDKLENMLRVIHLPSGFLVFFILFIKSAHP